MGPLKDRTVRVTTIDCTKQVDQTILGFGIGWPSGFTRFDSALAVILPLWTSSEPETGRGESIVPSGTRTVSHSPRQAHWLTWYAATRYLVSRKKAGSPTQTSVGEKQRAGPMLSLAIFRRRARRTSCFA